MKERLPYEWEDRKKGERRDKRVKEKKRRENEETIRMRRGGDNQLKPTINEFFFPHQTKLHRNKEMKECVKGLRERIMTQRDKTFEWRKRNGNRKCESKSKQIRVEIYQRGKERDEKSLQERRREKSNGGEGM